MSKELVNAAAHSPIMLCAEPCDMRLGLPGLAKKVKAAGKDPKGKELYVFVSRDYRRVKLFYWDNNGYAMWYKFVPSSIFRVEQTGGYRRITGVKLAELIGRTEKPKKISNA